MTSITVTVPTGPGEIAAYKIAFPAAKFDEVVDMVGDLSGPADLKALHDAGHIEIVAALS